MFTETENITKYIQSNDIADVRARAESFNRNFFMSIHRLELEVHKGRVGYGKVCVNEERSHDESVIDSPPMNCP